MYNVARPRELRSKSGARVREGVDIEMDVAEDEGVDIEVSKSRSSSRMKGHISREKSNVVVMQEALHYLGVRESRSVSASPTLRNGIDVPEIGGQLYTGRSLQSTPRLVSTARTPSSSLRGS